MNTLQKSLNEAEINARKMDDKNILNLKEVERQERIANELGYGLYKKKDVNRANFVQTISDNWNKIVTSDYLTNSEMVFLMSIHSLIEYSVNAIADPNTGQFMTVSDIARYLNRARPGVSKIIQSLLRKGVLFEFVNSVELLEFKRNVSKRTLFMNPELFYTGNRNQIDGTLCVLVSEYDILEKNNILLDWKVWKKQGETFGKLYRRKTYLKYKRNINKV